MAVGLLLIGLWVMTALLFPLLPDRIPTQFGLNGQLSGWGSKEVFWLLPSVSTAVVALCFVLGRLVYINHETLNLPHKTLFLSLDEEARNRVVARVDASIGLLMLAIILLFASLQWIAVQVALGTTLSSLNWLFWGSMFGVTVVIFWMIWDSSQAVRQEANTITANR